MKKSKKALTLDKLVISKLTHIQNIIGGDSLLNCQSGELPVCPRPTTCGGTSCDNGKCPSKQATNDTCTVITTNVC